MSNKILFIVIIIIIAIIGKTINKNIRKTTKGKKTNSKLDNNYSVKPLITKYERYFYDIFVELENELDIKVMPQVNLSSIINKDTNQRYRTELFRNIDFGIFTKDYSKILLLIEINDNTHNQKKRIRRDKKVDEIVRKANIKLIKFYSNYPNKKEYVKERVKKEISNLISN